jgi:hypothetical protein
LPPDPRASLNRDSVAPSAAPSSRWRWIALVVRASASRSRSERRSRVDNSDQAFPTGGCCDPLLRYESYSAAPEEALFSPTDAYDAYAARLGHHDSAAPTLEPVHCMIKGMF